MLDIAFSPRELEEIRREHAKNKKAEQKARKKAEKARKKAEKKAEKEKKKAEKQAQKEVKNLSQATPLTVTTIQEPAEQTSLATQAAMPTGVILTVCASLLVCFASAWLYGRHRSNSSNA